MPAAPHWDLQPGPWDTLVLGGVTLPGLSRVSGRIGRKMDVRSRPNADGARTRDRGYEPARLEAENRVWSDEQLEALSEALRVLNPRGNNPPPVGTDARRALDLARQDLTRGRAPLNVTNEALQAKLADLNRRAEAERQAEARAVRESTRTPVDIVYPTLSILGIRSVYVVGVSLPVLRNGELHTTISLLEWTDTPAPAPRPATTSTSSEAAGGGSSRDTQTAFAEHRAASAPTASPPGRVVGAAGGGAGAAAGGAAGG